MSALPALAKLHSSPLPTAEPRCLTSFLPTTTMSLFSTAKLSRTPLLPFLPSRPLRLPFLSSSSFSLKKASFVPLVAQTSDWAKQEEEGGNVAQEEGWENGEEEYQEWQKGPEAGLHEVGGGEGDGAVAVEEKELVGSSSVLEGSGEVEGEYPEPPEEAKLFVGNIPYDMDSESLAKLFDQAGTVEIAEVIYNRQTDQSRGFGFVTMSTVEEAEKAVEILNRYDLNGRLLTVNKAAPRGSQPQRPPRDFEPSFRVYVGNLPWQVDDSRLEQVFSEHGKVVDARVVYDRESGRSRGFGFVTMATQTEVDDAIAALDGQSLDGRALRVNVAEERPRRGPF